MIINTNHFEVLVHRLSVEFWSTLQFLAKVSGDNSVALIAVEPEPLYYYVHFGHYGAVDIAVTLSSDEYQNALSWTPNNSPADALEQARILAWLPPSLKWAVWRERDSEMMLLAYAHDFEPPSDVYIHHRSGLYLLSTQDALDVASGVWRERRTRNIFARELIKAYGTNNPREWQDSDVARALDIARKLITGDIGIIEGARTLSALKFQLGDDVSEILATFTLIDSETDHLPLGHAREEWAPEALARKDTEITGSEQSYKDLARRAAKELIARLTASD